MREFFEELSQNKPLPGVESIAAALLSQSSNSAL
jgi:hypothetical protein